MPFDVFSLYDSVDGEHPDHFESLVRIDDPTIEHFVRERRHEGDSWPNAVVQINPAYVAGPVLSELPAAQRDESSIVTTGTGSAKSLSRGSIFGSVE